MRTRRDVYLNDKPWEEALAEYLQHLAAKGALQPGTPEVIPTEQALGRVTAEPVFAQISSPHYNASAMDGIAVDSAITFGASDATPKRLQLGDKAQVVDTGDPIPPGCDAVIMIEDVHFVTDDVFEITSAAAPWQHVRAIGEDVVATEMILPANHTVRPVDIGGILAGDVGEIKVHPRPRVALLPTGTELVQPGTELKPGDIVEYNTRVFGAMIETWGGEPMRRPITIDDWDQLKNTIMTAVEEADVVVINAGSSAGREDFTADLIRELGTVLTHGAAIKPGKPVILGEIKGKPVIGVPGYPVSAALCMELFVRPIIYRKLGSTPPPPQTTSAIISRKMPSPMGVEEFIRVKLGQVGEKIVATPISRGAGVIMSMVRADGMLRVPRLSEGFRAGDTVTVELMRPLEEVRQTTVIIGSHDMALDVLANHLRRKFPAASLSSANVGSLGGLSAIKRGECHCAGTHLLDEETGDYNVSYVKRLLGDRPVVLVNLVYRQQGLMVAKGNPLGIKGLEDLTREGIRFINRQRGAGTRILLDYRLQQLGIDPDSIYGYNREEYTHMAVAAAVASGAADAALGIKAAANALGLDFVPVVEERYDLCIPGEFWDTPYITRLLEVMATSEFRQQVAALGGYDLRDCGGVMYRQGI
ncbi:molybdenum cofactor synthesis domain protein [Desulfotomaculum nigrificans CO-1-SRB]|uniref:Molybdopterin molybdenumtransferase n=1 Tax=Desulfotomaculum nigrificans (strain DSM 14880 / VKM B-2319 / CO-1-SRB) TaxID=868595 RepID=F6B7B9_DESCC|nr:molybdopterin biosynthesis protein [Desulfotomaculum nigrificans]AEF93369.1 molybdenum cofactor synthesis domain protein [Desulfotomaculum nigrificans CO-1-SRB]